METLPGPSSTDNSKPNWIMPRRSGPAKDDRDILIFEFRGYTVFIGRNALSNENLIVNHGHPMCLWMHVQGSKGPHLIICTKGCTRERTQDADLDALRYAAKLAIKYSRSESSRVAYAPLEDVYKPANSGSGIFRTWKTNFIEVTK